MLMGRNMLVLWKYLKEQCLLVTFSEGRGFCREVQFWGKLGNIGRVDLLSAERQNKNQPADKIGLEERATQSWDLWALKSVMSHFSYSSACAIVDVFKAAFPDSNIAQRISYGPTKLSYLITFGIALYYKQLLVEDLKKAPCFVVLFDESLSTKLHQEQMDFNVRHFKNGQVMTWYLSLAFLGHTTAEDPKLKFEEANQI